MNNQVYKVPPQLRVKIASLGAEQRIIKSMEQRIRDRLRKRRARLSSVPDTLKEGITKIHGNQMEYHRASLHFHRVVEVRREARAAHLAACFLRGTPYAACEGSERRSKPNWDRVENIIARFTHQDIRDVKQQIEEWSSAQ